MKKHLIPLLIMAVLSVGLLCGSTVAVSSAENDVVVTETILQGDHSVIDGLTVQIRMDEFGEAFNSNSWFLLRHTFGNGDTLELSRHFRPFSLELGSQKAKEAEPPALHHEETVGFDGLITAEIVADVYHDRIYGWGVQNGAKKLRILRESTREMLGEYSFASDKMIYGLAPGDDFCIVFLNPGEPAVLLTEQNGGYEETFTFPIPDFDPDNAWAISDLERSWYDYHDGKLFMVDRGLYVGNCDYYIAVYSEKGTEFEAEYMTSLRRGGWYISFDNDTPLAAAEWEGTI